MRGMMRTAGAMLAALVMAACAGNAAGNGEGGNMVRVVVQNDGAIPTQARIYLMPDAGGGQINLGTMSTLGTETLNGRIPVGGTYQLRAEGGTGYVLTSPRIQLRVGDMVTWDMRQNTVRVNQ